MLFAKISCQIRRGWLTGFFVLFAFFVFLVFLVFFILSNELNRHAYHYSIPGTMVEYIVSPPAAAMPPAGHSDTYATSATINRKDSSRTIAAPIRSTVTNSSDPMRGVVVNDAHEAGIGAYLRICPLSKDSWILRLASNMPDMQFGHRLVVKVAPMIPDLSPPSTSSYPWNFNRRSGSKIQPAADRLKHLKPS